MKISKPTGYAPWGQRAFTYLRAGLLLAPLALLFLAACSEFGEEQRTYTRAVRSPEGVASPANEFDSSTTSGVPLLTIDTPNSQAGNLQVHTIINQPSTPAPSASTAPALQTIPQGHTTIDLTPQGTPPSTRP